MIPMMRRHRKLFGGGMRQSGILAAAALYALEHNVNRLADDHRRAGIIADAVNQTETLTLEPEQVDTNIVIFRLADELGSAQEFCQRLYESGVWVLPFSRRHVRAVTHLHITDEDAHAAGDQIRRLAETA